MDGDSGPISRRSVLASGAVGVAGFLAGCPACANSPMVWDDRLRVGVEDFRPGDPHEYVLSVHHRGPDDFDGTRDREDFGTRYEGVEIHAFAHDRTPIASVDVGEMSHGTTGRDSVESAAVPFVVTASAETATEVAEDNCYYAKRGAEHQVYLGRFDTAVSVGRVPDTFETVDGPGGHQWATLGWRRHGDELPPQEWDFQRTKCFQHAGRQVESLPTPSLDALDGAGTWVDQPIDAPTVQRHHSVGVTPTRAYQEGHAEQFQTTHSTVAYRSLPDRVKEAIIGGRDVGSVSESEFYRLLSALEGRQISAVDELPDCERTHVVCNDERGVKCEGARARYGGDVGRYFWFHTTYEGEPYVVVPGQEATWLEPSATTPTPCMGGRGEQFTVTIYGQEKRYRGLETARAGVEAPAVLERWARTDPDSYAGKGLSESQWVDVLRTLEGRSSVRRPQCQWPNVQCHRNGNVRCGSGEREAFYTIDVDGASWWFRLTYEWQGT